MHQLNFSDGTSLTVSREVLDRIPFFKAKVNWQAETSLNMEEDPTLVSGRISQVMMLRQLYQRAEEEMARMADQWCYELPPFAYTSLNRRLVVSRPGQRLVLKPGEIQQLDSRDLLNVAPGQIELCLDDLIYLVSHSRYTAARNFCPVNPEKQADYVTHLAAICPLEPAGLDFLLGLGFNLDAEHQIYSSYYHYLLAQGMEVGKPLLDHLVSRKMPMRLPLVRAYLEDRNPKHAFWGHPIMACLYEADVEFVTLSRYSPGWESLLLRFHPRVLVLSRILPHLLVNHSNQIPAALSTGLPLDYDHLEWLANCPSETMFLQVIDYIIKQGFRASLRGQQLPRLLFSVSSDCWELIEDLGLIITSKENLYRYLKASRWELARQILETGRRYDQTLVTTMREENNWLAVQLLVEYKIGVGQVFGLFRADQPELARLALQNGYQPADWTSQLVWLRDLLLQLDARYSFLNATEMVSWIELGWGSSLLQGLQNNQLQASEETLYETIKQLREIRSIWLAVLVPIWQKALPIRSCLVPVMNIYPSKK